MNINNKNIPLNYFNWVDTADCERRAKRHGLDIDEATDQELGEIYEQEYLQLSKFSDYFANTDNIDHLYS